MTTSFTPEGRGASSFSKEALRGGGTRKATFGTATFGSARFGQTQDGIVFDKEALASGSPTDEVLPGSSFSAEAQPSTSFTKEAQP